ALCQLSPSLQKGLDFARPLGVRKDRIREAVLRLALFQKAGSADVLPGLITQDGVVSVSDLVSHGPTPQLTMTGIIDDFERLLPDLERRGRDGDAKPIAEARLCAQLPRMGM